MSAVNAVKLLSYLLANITDRHSNEWPLPTAAPGRVADAGERDAYAPLSYQMSQWLNQYEFVVDGSSCIYLSFGKSKEAWKNG